MKRKKLLLVPLIALLLVGGAYKTVLAKPSSDDPKPKVDGSVYVLGKEFLVNLKDGRFAKLSAALVLAHDDASTSAAAHGGSPPPEGYGTMTQEGVVRAVITEDLTNATDQQLIDADKRAALQEKILKDLKRQTDVKVEKVLFPDLTVQ
jgi:flagellar FliL protein